MSDSFVFTDSGDFFNVNDSSSQSGSNSANIQSAAIAPQYSATSTYSVGDYVLYNGMLYICNTAITTAEAWNSSHWTATNVMAEVEDAGVDISISGTGLIITT